MFGAKLSWCQIVQCQIFLVPNYPFLLFWCQIVRFYYFGAKLSSAKLSGAKLSGAKLSYNPSSSSLPAPKAQERWRNNKELHQVPLANCRSAILTLMKAMMIMTLPIIIDYDNGHGHASDVRYYLFSSPFSRQ